MASFSLSSMNILNSALNNLGHTDRFPQTLLLDQTNGVKQSCSTRFRSFLLISLPHPLPLNQPLPHTIMDIQNKKRRNDLTHAQLNFSQSERSSLLGGGGGGRVELKLSLLLLGGVNRKDPQILQFCV